jgi:hypothetical protein
VQRVAVSAILQLAPPPSVRTKLNALGAGSLAALLTVGSANDPAPSSDDPDSGIFPPVSPKAAVHGIPSAVVFCNVGCLFWHNLHDHVLEMKCECGQTFAVCGYCVNAGREFTCLSCAANKRTGG